MNICIIPARAGSKRLPNKNVKLWNGNPIIMNSVNKAIMCRDQMKIIDKIVVSTNSKIVKDIIKAHEGYNIKIHNRNKELSDDKTGLKEVLLDVIKDKKVDNILLLYPCAPLISVLQIIASYEVFNSNKYNTVFPIIKRGSAANQDLKLVKKFVLPVWDNHDGIMREQTYKHAGHFFWIKKSWIEKGNSIVSGKCGYIELKEWEAQDINTLDDWDLAMIKANK